ncbi:heme-dependent oxidative N-demethylase subunit alpha family protein [Hydrogenophaga sp. RWCD_12]|uniref:heme-dependent oxidative N-demethylase subunit alpha family protein n=1 Tax=Hydrogenophaga sp. RWCD_12 TaxID=3391190 RepID=UPI00398487BA
MRPGLARLPHVADSPSPALFVRDAQAAAYASHKRQVLQAQPRRAPVGAAEPAVLTEIAQAYLAQTGIHLAPEADALAEGMQEDFVILHGESDGAGDTMRARFLSVCFPSNWDPAEKLGLDFATIHAPVADNALLQAGARGIIDMAFRQAPMLRHVWLLTPGGDLAQHPETRRTRWDDAVGAADTANGRLIDQVFFRVERQTTLPLPALRRGVFFIRVLVAPLADVLAAAPGRSAALRDALLSMSDAVVAYRGMAAVRERLCAELALATSGD